MEREAIREIILKCKTETYTARSSATEEVWADIFPRPFYLEKT